MLQTQENWYAGIDLHKTYSYVTVMDRLGEIKYQGRHDHHEQTLIPMLKSFPTQVVVSLEATYGWYAQADELEENGVSFVLAHPTKINAVAGKKKTDKEDSKILANLHRNNLLAQSFVPTKPQRELRQLVRFRLQLVQSQSIIKTRIRDLLQKQRLTCPYRDVYGVKSLEWLMEQTMAPVYQKQIRSLLKQGQVIREEVEGYNQIMASWSKRDTQAKLLQSIPGVGSIISVLLVSEIGSIDRFENVRAFASYCGVTPSVKSSGGKTYLGKTNKHANAYLRWCLAEAVVHLNKKDPVAKQKYDQLVKTKGKGKAKVALMNKTARIVFAVLKRQTPYQEQELPPSD